MSRQPHLYAATFGLLVNKEGEVLLLKRKNTGYYDGGYSLPAGHVEDGETAFQSLAHELEEELGIQMIDSSVTPLHILHRLKHDRQYFDLCFIIHNWKGSIRNKEPDKCEELHRCLPDQLPEYTTEEAKIFVNSYLQGTELKYSELDQRK